MRSVVYALLAMMLVAGCAGSKDKHATIASKPSGDVSARLGQKNGKVIITSETSSSGKVVTVDGNLHFAVLNFPIGTVPSAGQYLNAYRRGLKVGELKINGPQGDENAVADITKGEVKIGDEVRMN